MVKPTDTSSGLAQSLLTELLTLQAQQCANRGIKKGNASGFKGVSLIKATGKWNASIKIKGKSKNLGSYATPEEASAVYKRALTEAYGEFARS